MKRQNLNRNKSLANDCQRRYQNLFFAYCSIIHVVNINPPQPPSKRNRVTRFLTTFFRKTGIIYSGEKALRDKSVSTLLENLTDDAVA